MGSTGGAQNIKGCVHGLALMLQDWPHVRSRFCISSITASSNFDIDGVMDRWGRWGWLHAEGLVGGHLKKLPGQGGLVSEWEGGQLYEGGS